jgi:hypothetical protein
MTTNHNVNGIGPPLSPYITFMKLLVKNLQEKHNHTPTKILLLPGSGYTLWIETYKYAKGMSVQLMTYTIDK